MQGRDAGSTAGVCGGHASSIAGRVVSAFLSRGYRIVDYSDTRGCVDFIAKSSSRVFAVRVLSNVDALREESVAEFVRLAAAVGATPLIVGERTKRDVLSDDVVYRRYGVSVVTPATLERILDGDIPVLEEFRGRRVVYFDPEALRRARESLGLSQNDLAREIGTTKDSVYRYERGFPASEATARKIVGVLGSQVLAPVDIGFKGRVERCSVFEFRRAPWDVFVSVRQSLALSRARGVIKRKIEILRRGSGVIHDYYAVVVKSESKAPENVPVLTEEDLRSAERPEELVKKVRDELDEIEG